MESVEATMLKLEQGVLAVLSPPGMDYTKGQLRGLPLMTFGAAVLSVSIYLVVVFFGHKYMRSRETIINLRPLQYIYNAVQVGLCGYLVYASATEAQKLGYNLVCNQFDASADAGNLPTLLYIFYLSKALDFLDTCFIVFHKKDTQLSFLHLYHHVTIFLTYWVNANIFYSGDIYYTIVANGAVHTVMYAYYFLSMLNTYDRNDKNAKQPYPLLGEMLLASKPFITAMQLLQFVTMMWQAVTMLTQDCGCPRTWTMYYLGYIFSLFVLFMQFAMKNYCGKKGGKKGGKNGDKKKKSR